MGRVVISRKKRRQVIPDTKDEARAFLPKPKGGILSDEGKERLFEYLKSLNKGSLKTLHE
jgi:hypothetical protein